MSHDPEEATPRARGRAWQLPADVLPYQGQRAGLVTRLAAGIVDGVVVGVVSVIGYFALAFVIFLIAPHRFEFPRLGLVLSLTSGAFVAFVYMTLAWALTGRSYGNHVMGLRVLGRGGRPLRLLGAAARALLLVLAPIGILWVPISGTNRSLQDVVLRTEVVYDWQPRGVRARSARLHGR